jgi:hypothetical protein
MSIESGLTDFRYIGEDPFNKSEGELKLGPNGVRFILPREKRKRKYTVVYDAEWSEVISYENCAVHRCKDDLSWPLDETLPTDYESLGKSGMLFIFLRTPKNAFFQVWGFYPENDVTHVGELIEQYMERPSVPGLAHHATAAPVRYIVDHCQILSQFRAQWHDWLHTRSTVKPREHLREIGPNYIFCKEGMAIDFYGAGEQLEQMSTFWPWRVMGEIFAIDTEIIYQWYEDAYSFRQQVSDDKERHAILSAAKDALEKYNSLGGVKEYLFIRPWSFPSRFHRTWDKLEPFACKASRNYFPPILDFDDEEVEDGSII